MAVKQERRLNVTFPSTGYKDDLTECAKAKDMSVSAYVIRRLELLKMVERTPVGKKLVDSLEDALTVAE